MPTPPGVSGNPEGTRNKKFFLDALHSLISIQWEDESTPPKPPRNSIGAHHLAYKLVSGAVKKDWKPQEALAYMQEMCDRAYGKSKQSHVGGDDDDPPISHSLAPADRDLIERYLEQKGNK